MPDKRFNREFLEELFSGEGLSRRELNHILGKRPGALSRFLTSEFISNIGAVKRGDFEVVGVRGFVISAPSHFETLFLSSKPRLEGMLGEGSALAVVSPSPTDVTFALPAVVPRSISTKRELNYARFVSLQATILNLEMFGGAPARFLLAKEMTVVPFEDFFSARAPVFTGKEVLELLQERMNINFSEVRLALLAHLYSAPPFLDRAGGTGLSLLACEDRMHCLSKGSLAEILKDLRMALPPYLTHKRFSSHLDYSGTRPVPLRFAPQRLHWRFDQREDRAATFLDHRPARTDVLEESLSTRYLLEMRDYDRDFKQVLRKPSDRQRLMSVSDLPVLLGREDIARDESISELLDSSEDIAHSIIHASIVNPKTVLDQEDRFALVKRILREIHRDWPELETCMKRQVFFDLSADGGLLEHATRATGALVRAYSLEPHSAEENVQEMYVRLFARFYDTLEPKLRHINAVLEKRDRELRGRLESKVVDAFESAFFELGATYPDGWPYPELERLVLNQVNTGRAGLKRYFEMIRLEGEVVEVAPGVFRRVSVAELF